MLLVKFVISTLCIMHPSHTINTVYESNDTTRYLFEYATIKNRYKLTNTYINCNLCKLYDIISCM